MKPNRYFQQLKWAFAAILLLNVYAESLAQETYKRGVGITPRKRLEWYWQSRMDSNGQPVNAMALNQKAAKIAEKMTMPVDEEQRSFSGDWSFAGPATLLPNYYSGIGRVNRIAFHPTDTAIIYAATAGGGLWMTPNHGTVWYPLSDYITVSNLTGIVVNAADSDILYILTGDGETGGEGNLSLQKTSIGVLRSMDGGGTWSTTGLSWGEQERVSGFDLIGSPNDPEHLIACTSKGLFVSPNGGDAWERTYTRGIYSAMFKPENPDVLYAVGSEYLYRSMDAGETWVDSVQVPLFEGKKGRMRMDISADDPNKIYVIAGPGSDSTATFRGMFVYDEQNDTLMQISNSPNLTVLDENGGGDQSNYDLALAVDPENANRMMMGAVHMHRSLDGGLTWFDIPKNEANTYHDDVHYLVVHPITGSLYAGTDGGIYYSPDFGDHWTYISEYMSATQYYRIAVSQQDPYITIGGMQDNGTNMKTANNTEFTKVYGKDGMDCAIHPLDDDLMIFSSQDGEFALSLDGGTSSDSLINVKSLPGVQSSWVTPIVWDPNNPDNIWVGYRPIYYSNDMGQTFQPIADTIGGRMIMHIGTNNPDRLYASDVYKLNGGNLVRLWSSDDGGDTWYPCHNANTFPDSNLIITGLTTNPDNSAQVWICVGGWNADQKVYRSLDGGVTWSNMTGNLPNTPVHSIIYHDTGGVPADAVYIGTDIGVFYRNNALGDWKYYSNRLPRVEVTDLEISYAANQLRVGTYGRGIWQSDLFSGCQNQISLNEFNQFTGVTYEFQANQLIQAQGVIIDGEGSEVRYRSGNYILLKQDFRALSGKGAYFKASIGPCGAVID
jgi:photosystem II stability/assembly factor-like uncharacterized protein